MKLSLKVEYACRVLAQLASRHQGAGLLCHIDTLAEAEALPSNYLVQILNELRNGGLVVSRRGKQGGYGLGRAAEEISLLDVIRVLDPEMLEAGPSPVGESGPRVAEVWSEIGSVLEERLRAYTIHDLLAVGQENMYYI